MPSANAGAVGGRALADVEPGLDVSLREAMCTQRAVRRLLPDPVDDAIVLRCIELALKAPTGSNGQNWEFVVVKDSTVKAGLARMNRRAVGLYGGVGQRGDPGNEAPAEKHHRVLWQAAHFVED